MSDTSGFLCFSTVLLSLMASRVLNLWCSSLALRKRTKPLSLGGVVVALCFLASLALLARSGPFAPLLVCGYVYFKASDDRGFLFIPPVAECGEARHMVAVVFYSGASRCSASFFLGASLRGGGAHSAGSARKRRRATDSVVLSPRPQDQTGKK